MHFNMHLCMIQNTKGGGGVLLEAYISSNSVCVWGGGNNHYIS